MTDINHTHNSALEPDDLGLDDLRAQWRELDSRVDRLAERVDTLGGAPRGRTASLQKQLKLRYMLMACIALTLPGFGYMLYSLGLPLFVVVLYGIGGIIMGIANLWMARQFGNTDLYSLPTVEALRRASRLIEWQVRGRRIGYVFAAVILTPMFYEFIHIRDYWTLGGATVGLILGLILGECKHRHLHKLSRRWRDTINQDNENE